MSTPQDFERLLHTIAGALAHRDIKIRVLEKAILKTGWVSEDNLREVYKAAWQESFRITRYRFIRTLKASLAGQTLEEADKALLEEMAALEEERPMPDDDDPHDPPPHA